MRPNEDISGAKAGRREWIGLAVIALPCLLYSMDLTVLNLAIPFLSTALKPTPAQLLWIVDIYGFVLAGFLITMGTLGDRIGRRRLLLIGAAAFGSASVVAAFSQSAAMLIATRAVLGIAGATLAPSTLSLIRNMFLDERQRTTAIGIWITSYSVGGAIGPLVGGVLLDHFWWGSVFLISVPVMVLLLIVGPILLPEFRDPKAERMDLVSAVLSLGAVLLVIYGIKQVAQGVGGAVPTLTIVGGVVVGTLFIRRQQTLTHPLIDLRLFKARAFSTALAAYTLATFVAFGIFLYISQYLQVVRGLTPIQSGVCMLPIFASFIGGSMFAPVIARRIRPTLLMGAGFAVSAIGFFVLTQIDVTSSVATIVTGCLIYSLGLAPVFTLTTDMIVGAAPPERAGAAAALSETGSELGGALGIAVLGSVGTAAYRHAMAGVGPGVITIGASDAAKGAFSHALVIVACVSTVVVIATAVAVVLTFDSNRTRTGAVT